jgi:thiol:disulfide interchange protein
MTRLVASFCVVVLMAGAVLSAQQSGSTATPFPGATDKFDPTRDPVTDLAAAVVDAKRSHRRIILDVGGEWCGWCHILDRYFAAQPELTTARDRSYVWLKINMSGENKNEAFLAKYPTINGYPHLFVLEQDGTLLHSQDTALLEQGSSYNLDKMREFLTKWAPAAKSSRP